MQPSGGWLHPCRTVSGGLGDAGRAGMRSPRKKMTDADIFPGQQQRLMELMHRKGECPSPSRVCVWGGTPTTPQLLNWRAATLGEVQKEEGERAEREGENDH